MSKTSAVERRGTVKWSVTRERFSHYDCFEVILRKNKTKTMADSASTQSALGSISLSFAAARCLSYLLNQLVRYPSSIRDGPVRKQWLYRNIWISLIHSTITAVLSVVRYSFLSLGLYFELYSSVSFLFGKLFRCIYFDLPHAQRSNCRIFCHL